MPGKPRVGSDSNQIPKGRLMIQRFNLCDDPVKLLVIIPELPCQFSGHEGFDHDVALSYAVQPGCAGFDMCFHNFEPSEEPRRSTDETRLPGLNLSRQFFRAMKNLRIKTRLANAKRINEPNTHFVQVGTHPIYNSCRKNTLCQVLIFFNARPCVRRFLHSLTL
jgi:hypothetical protein